MAQHLTWQARRTRWMNRVQARLAGWGTPATGFTSSPEPRTIGSFARGRQLVAGNLLFAGHLVEAPNQSIWTAPSPDPMFAEEIQGCIWLDDLAAVGDSKTLEKAQDWVFGWIDLYGRGTGPGWTPDLTGRRVIRWINHALFILRGVEAEKSHAFYRALARQTTFLGRRWRAASSGLPRIEALTGLIYAGLALEGMSRHVRPAAEALARDCARQIDDEGGIPTRNPEELLEVFTLLSWAAAALSDADETVPDALTAAIQRIAPTLRALRHADGNLARFHGGGRGLEGRLDHALANSGVKARAAEGLSMGFARLSAGRTSIIVDAAPPPDGKASCNAHASTLAFEMTSGRRPVIVNCGSGAPFGRDWWRAGRATPSHSALGLSGYSMARLGGETWVDGQLRELLVEGPRDVRAQVSQAPDGIRFEGGHNGYVRSHGLTHARIVDLTFDGRAIAGEDLLATLDPASQKRFDQALDATNLQGIDFGIRFHLHPEVEANLDMAGAAVSLALKSGEVWVFRHDGVGTLTVEPSVYLEKGRLKPRAAKQIVLSGRAIDYATRIRWSLAKAQDSEGAIRDLAPAPGQTAD